MKFSSYIFISVIFHMTLTLLLGMVSYYDETSSNIFDVDVVAPFEPVQQETIQKIKPVIKKRKKPVLVKKRRPPEKNLKPDTLFSENTGPAESTNKSPEQAHKETEKTPVASIQKEDDNSKPGKDAITTIPPSALFDRKTINKFASKGPSKDKGMTFEAPELKNRGYMRLLRDKIENIWKYPREAARLGRSGDLYIKFFIKKDGSLGKVELIRTSGHRELDEAAIKALKDAQPYWPLPDNWKDEELEINGHFIYVYGTTYLL
jgi:protein TonB